MLEVSKLLISVQVNGTIEKKPITSVGLEDLKKIVDGYIEIIPYFNKFENMPCVAFCNEDGKIKRLPVNETATRLWIASLSDVMKDGLDDFLVGPIAIVVGPRSFLNKL